jgi:GDPmannose 4,6-dehydratase
MKKMKKAFITGVNGQDGSWLAYLLLNKGYEVYGGMRRNSQPNLYRLKTLGINEKINFVDFELTDQSNIIETIRKVKPDEFYNLAAQSFVATSFAQPISTNMIDYIGYLYVLDAIRLFSPNTRVYQASTSEMFGNVQEIPQKESTPFYPRSPYGVAKLASHWASINYRESYNLFISSGILFNHESELRGEEFVTKKITMQVASWANNNKGKILELGNIESKRDWGYAREYVEGMYLMLQSEKPDTFILATGKTYTIREFVESAFKVIGRNIEWSGKGVDEVGIDKTTGDKLVIINKKFFRPAEVELLIGDSSKAQKILKWQAKTDLNHLVEKMVKFDIDKKLVL